MDAEELELFERSLRHSTANHTGEALDAALAELGWADAHADDPRAAVSILFELQGDTGATSSALDQVMARALGLDLGVGAVVLPPLGRWDAPGRLEGAGLAVRGVTIGSPSTTGSALVVATSGGGEVAAVVDAGSLTLREVSGMDPHLGLVEVVSDGVAAGDLSPVGWDAAVAAGHLALGHELVGAARAMLRLAREHALERIQFGRPIGSFQAVRHRLAETFVAIESADAALAAAWEVGSPHSAMMAKAMAGRAARTAARHCQQVLAGIGFTTEHPLHRYVRRALVLDRLLGDARSLTRRSGEEILRNRRLPDPLPL